MIKIENLNKIYPNGVQALFNLNLSIQENDFVVFVGPSGCGKSTTLRLISGLESITSGKLIIDKKLANNLTPKERRISMVFQNYALYPHLSIYKNIRFPLENDKQGLYLSYKNNYLLKKEVKKLFYTFNNEANDQINAFTLKNESIIQNKFDLKELKSKFASDFLKLRSDFINVKSNHRLSRRWGDIATKKAISKANVHYQNEKKALKNDFATAKKRLLISQTKTKKELKQIRNGFKKRKGPAFNHSEFTKEKKRLIKEKKIQKPYITWRKQNHKRVMRVVNILGLSHFAYRKPRDLSGGQRQRVALGRAIVRNPRIFLLDEPLSNLDAKLRTSMRETILNIHNKINAATIYVTHDQVEAMTMATKIVILKDGFVQQIATPSEVYNKPSNMFVASFVGSPEINFFNGELKGGKFVCPEIGFVIPKGVFKKIQSYVDRKIILGVRPESISSRSEIIDTYQDTKMNFEIASKELLGKEVIFYGKINGGQKLRRVILNTSDVFIQNNSITLGLNKNHLHFFDPQTSESVSHSKSPETAMALKIWREGESKRLINKKLLQQERKKLENKGIFNKIVHLVQDKLQRRQKNDGKD